MFYQSELQLINTEHSMEASIYAVHQSFSGFNTAELGRLHSAVVIGSVTVGTDV